MSDKITTRVAFLTHYAEMFGANRSLLDLIDGLRPYGVESFVITPDLGDFTRALEKRGVAFRQLAIQEWMVTSQAARNRWQRLYLNLRVLPYLLSQLREWQIHVVHTNTSVIGIGEVAALLLGKPHIWHFRELAELHYGTQPDWGKRAFDWLVSKSTAQIAVSRSVREHVLAGQPDGKAWVIYNGVATEARFDELCFRARHREWKESVFTFLMLGMFHPSKGQEEAIRALARVVTQFPQARLVFAGPMNYSYASSCQSLVADLGLNDKVVFTGWVSDPSSLYLEANALLMCSRSEGLGRVTVEAMSNCLPVIGFNSGGTTEIIGHERTGLLYSGGEEELAACMTRFIENPAWVRKLGEQAWQEARSRFTTEIYARQVYEVVKKALQ